MLLYCSAPLSIIFSTQVYVTRHFHYVKQYSHLPPSEPECQGTTDGYKQFVTVSYWTISASCLAISEITISRSLFWSSSDILYNVDEICSLADEYMNRAVHRESGREASHEDLDLLRQALKHAYGLSSLHRRPTDMAI